MAKIKTKVKRPKTFTVQQAVVHLGGPLHRGPLYRLWKIISPKIHIQESYSADSRTLS